MKTIIYLTIFVCFSFSTAVDAQTSTKKIIYLSSKETKAISKKEDASVKINNIANDVIEINGSKFYVANSKKALSDYMLLDSFYARLKKDNLNQYVFYVYTDDAQLVGKEEALK